MSEGDQVSTAPQALKELQTFLIASTGLRAVSLGIVGNTKHLSGYHLGRDRIFGPKGKGADDYSVKPARDQTGLSNAVSAMDIGSFRRLREMSKWIVAEARADAPDTRDIREVIYSPDGVKVLRWDRQRGITSRPKTGEADNSHQTHTHISWYRDSENRDKTALFVRFFEAAGPGTGTGPQRTVRTETSRGEVVKSFNIPAASSVCTVPKGKRLFAASDLRSVAFNIDPGRDMPFLGEPFPGVGMVHRTDEQGKPTGKVFFVRMTDITNIRPA